MNYCLDHFFWATRFSFLVFPYFFVLSLDHACHLVSFWAHVNVPYHIDGVDECILAVHLLHSFVCPLIWTDIVTTISECIEQFWWNWQWMFTSPTDDLIRFWKSEVEVAASRRGGEGINVNTGVSKTRLLVKHMLISTVFVGEFILFVNVQFHWSVQVTRVT